MTLPRYTCSGCGKEVAAYPLVYGSPFHQYVMLYGHNRPDGEPCKTGTMTVATKLRRR